MEEYVICLKKQNANSISKNVTTSYFNNKLAVLRPWCYFTFETFMPKLYNDVILIRIDFKIEMIYCCIKRQLIPRNSQNSGKYITLFYAINIK